MSAVISSQSRPSVESDIAPRDCEECVVRRAAVERYTARLAAKERDLAGYPSFTRRRLTESLRRDLRAALENLDWHEKRCGG